MIVKIDDIISYAKKNNLPSISLTDSNMFGTMEFIHKCEKQDIKPVIGLEVNLEDFTIVLYEKNYKSIFEFYYCTSNVIFNYFI